MAENEQQSPKKSGRGGYRPGAGRKPKANARKITTSFSLSPLAHERFSAYAQAQGTNFNDAMNRLWENDELWEILRPRD